jgi:acyl-CoA thioesterase
MSRFLADTAVTRVDENRWTAQISKAWWIIRGPNGGYLAALAMRALTETVGDPERAARSLTLHYLRPPVEGAVTIDVTVERSGRTLDSLSIRMTQNDRLLVIGLAAFAVDRVSESFDDLVMPDVARPEDLEPPPVPGEDVPMRAHYDQRWVFGEHPIAGEPRPDEPAVVGGWIRLAEATPLDHTVLAALSDAWLPAVFGKLSRPNPVPTVDLTVHFRDDPPMKHEWCLVQFTSRTLTRGYLEEDGVLWSEDGRVLANSRQLGVVLEMPG